MPALDILSAALSGPAGRVIEGPVRTIVNEVLQEHGYASPAEVRALRDDLAELSDLVARLSAEVEALREESQRLRERAGALAEASAGGGAAAEEPAAEVAEEPAAEVAEEPAAEVAEEPAAEEPAAEEAAAEDTAVGERAAVEAERLGLSLADYDRWRAGKLPGIIGPDGYIEIDGVAWRVDPSLEGRPYTLTRHKNPRVRVDGRTVSKTRVG